MRLSKNDMIKMAFAEKYSFYYLIEVQRELQFKWEMQRFSKHFGKGRTTSHRKGKVEQKTQELKQKVWYVRSVIQLKKSMDNASFPLPTTSKSLYEHLDLGKHNIYIKSGKYDKK